VSAHQLAGARLYKAEILRRKPDAAHVAGINPDRGRTAEEEGGGAAGGEASTDAPPSMPRALRARKMAQNEAEESPLNEPAPAPVNRMLSHTDKSRRASGGCASCAIGGSANDALAALLVLAAMMSVAFARRRRAGQRRVSHCIDSARTRGMR